MRSLLHIFLSLIFAGSVSAAVKSVDLNKNLKIHKQELSAITKEIYSLEANLGKGNQRYIKTLKNRKSLEDKMLALKKSIVTEQARISEKKEKAKLRLKQVMVQTLNETKDPAQLLSLRLVSKMLKKELNDLTKIQDRTLIIQKELDESSFEYERLQQVESDLLSLMNELEETKKNKSQRYVELKKASDELHSKLKVEKVKKYTKKQMQNKKTILIEERFSNPLTDFIDMEYGKKGITYKYTKRQNVQVSRAGKVIHTGSLSAYGNVVMVDHGNDVRSIFLGQFSPRVKKGQSVASGDSLGVTFDVAKNEGKLYFEVRKKNKAQNTVLLIDKNTIDKNNKRRTI